MKRLLMALLALTVVVACGSPTPPPTPAPPPSPTPVFEPTAATTPFFLEVLSPKNESVVAGALIEVSGYTVPDAVVTVNGQVVEVQADGAFVSALQLEAGPNTIDVIASDFSGNQASEILTVVYVP